MRVGIDISPLNSGHKLRGMGMYTRNLIEGLKKIDGLEVIEFDNTNQLPTVDLIHYPYFDFFFQTLPFKKRFPSVVTVGDVTPLIYPDHYPPGIRGSIKFKLQKLSLKNTKAVITFSKASKDDIRNYLNFPTNKIHSVYLASSKNFRKISDQVKLTKVKKKYNLPNNYALFVGSVNWNKNLLNLTESCLAAELDVCLVGKDFENKDNLSHPEKRSFKEFLDRYQNNPQVHILGFVSEEDLVSIYNLSICLLLPSFYEGFGLPILEAQACGCPVITSNLSSMPEVAGKGAILVDPRSVKDIAAAIERVRESFDFAQDKSESQRVKLIKSGFENIKRFSWEKTAQETFKVYQDAIK